MDSSLLLRILDISRGMAEMRAFAPLLDYVVEQAIQLVGAERGYIVLPRADGSLDFRVTRDCQGNVVLHAEDQISTSVLRKIISTGEPLMLRDAMTDPEFSAARSVMALNLRSVMGAPLISYGKAIGAIYVENRAIRNRFKEEDLPPLVIFAHQAAAAIENASLNDDLEARVAARTQELQATNAQLIEAQKIAQLGSWTLDLATNQFAWSAELCRITGRDPQAGAPTMSECEQAVHPDDWSKFKATLDSVIGTGAQAESEYRYRRPDGVTRVLMSRFKAQRARDGQVVQLVGTTQDITERKQAEMALRELNATLEQRVADRTAELLAANERLTILERLKSQFLANASHELRTPLTNIKTSLYLLERGKPEKREKYMTVLNNETALLQSLLEDLLDAADLDFGRTQPALFSVDLGQLLAQLVETSITLVAERHLRLDLAADPTTPFTLADAKMLRRAIKSLLLDTIDHETAGGRIVLHVQPFGAAGRAWAVLTVGGDAPAPTPDAQADLFALANVKGGPPVGQPVDTNLRLAVCRGVIAHHGGRMAVQPRAARSNIVTLWLPAA